MKVNKIKINKINITWAILLLIFVVAVLVVFPFVEAIISSYVLAFLLLPLFKIFNKKMGRGLSAFLCIVFLLILIMVPLFFIVGEIIDEVSVLNENVNSRFSSFSNGANSTSIDFSGDLGRFNLEDLWSRLVSHLTDVIFQMINSLPSILITILVTFFGVFYILYDWEKINSFIYRKTPLQNKDQLFKDVSRTTKRITYGLLLVGAIDFLVALIGFSISGVRFPLLFALIIGLLAFTLVLDPFVVWFPLVLVHFFAGDVGAAIGILITGLVLTTDTIFRPKIVGSVSKINPFVMLLGVLGGVALFGILGFIIGPIVLFFAVRLVKESFEISD